MKDNQAPVERISIPRWHQLMGLEEPSHPLISIINLVNLRAKYDLMPACYLKFYVFIINRSTEKNVRHARENTPSSAGIMTLFAPGQMLITDKDGQMPVEGLALMLHPDFLSSSDLKSFTNKDMLLTNPVNQVLTLSEGEENLLTGIFQKVGEGLQSGMDKITQRLILSMVEVLLNYCNRFDKHNFSYKSNSRNDILDKVDSFLSDHFNSDELPMYGMPTVQCVAERLNISPNYLSDILRGCTGRSTKQHIQDKLIMKAKEILLKTNLTVNEVAYVLGFEYPQSFGKLFKNKTGITPLSFKKDFNLNTDSCLVLQDRSHSLKY
jgi:AraC family transcriptional activator of pobA